MKEPNIKTSDQIQARHFVDERFQGREVSCPSQDHNPSFSCPETHSHNDRASVRRAMLGVLCSCTFQKAYSSIIWELCVLYFLLYDIWPVNMPKTATRHWQRKLYKHVSPISKSLNKNGHITFFQTFPHKAAELGPSFCVYYLLIYLFILECI